MIDDENFRNGTIAKVRGGVMYFSVTDFHFNNKNFQPSGPFLASSLHDILKNLRAFSTVVFCPVLTVTPIADRGMLCILGTENSFRATGFLCNYASQ